MRVQNCIIENKGNDFNFSKNENHMRNEKMERIINIEDSVIKHCEINRALQYNGSVMDGYCLQSINRQIGAPFLQAFRTSYNHSAIQWVQDL